MVKDFAKSFYYSAESSSAVTSTSTGALFREISWRGRQICATKKPAAISIAPNINVGDGLSPNKNHAASIATPT